MTPCIHAAMYLMMKCVLSFALGAIGGAILGELSGIRRNL